ncbi:hypothetical protein [uncultured Jatrophihabitans sp.]
MSVEAAVEASTGLQVLVVDDDLDLRELDLRELDLRELDLREL